MALSKEEFSELRKKGLSVEQIVAFEAGEKPTAPKPTTTFRESKPFMDTVTGLAKSAGKAVLGIGTVGRTLQEGMVKTVGADLPETSIFDIGSSARAEADQKLAPVSKAERTAGFVGDAAQFGIPSAGTAKALKGLGFVRNLLGRAGTGAITGTIQGGGDVDRDTAIGAGVEVAFPVAGRLVGYGGGVLKGLAGLVSGKGSDVIEQVLKTPKEALEGGAKAGVGGLKESASNIRAGVKALSKKAGQEYADLVSKAGVKELPKDDIVNGMKERLADLADGTIADDGIKFVDTPFTTGEEEQFKKVFNNIANWTDYTPEGVNKLASKISRFRRGGADSVQFDRVIDTLKRDLRGLVGKVAPTIKEANEKYADKADLLDQLDTLLKTDGAVNSREGLQKTAEAIGRLFNANKDLAREGVEEIERELGINILGKEAGRQLVDGVSRSQSVMADAVTGVTKALIPPKVLLNIVARTGQSKEWIEGRLTGIEDPAVRGAILEFVTDLFGEEANQ